MFCHHCGSQIADEATTCIHCGVAVATAAPPPPRAAPSPGLAYCRHCGAQIAQEAYLCVRCGVKTGSMLDPVERSLFPPVGKSWVVALLLAIFGGTFGLHRFYVGKIFTGVLMLVTLGGFGIWYVIDLIMIVLGGFDDDQGRPLVK